jgi:hypothetical protein
VLTARLSPRDVEELLIASGTTIAGGRKMINVNRALTMAVPAYTPRTVYSDGTGSGGSCEGHYWSSEDWG